VEDQHLGDDFLVTDSAETPFDRSYDSLATLNFSPYEDDFIAIIDGNVVGHNKDEKQLVREIRSMYPGKLPFIVKVPDRSKTTYI